VLEWLSSRTTTTNVGENMWKRNTHTLLVEYKLIQPLWKIVFRLLKKLKIKLPHDPAIPLLRIYPKECKSVYNKENCTSMFLQYFSQ
jgi:hypothetical protein